MNSHWIKVFEDYVFRNDVDLYDTNENFDLDSLLICIEIVPL
jgi:hypothetical protein